MAEYKIATKTDCNSKIANSFSTGLDKMPTAKEINATIGLRTATYADYGVSYDDNQLVRYDHVLLKDPKQLKIIITEGLTGKATVENINLSLLGYGGSDFPSINIPGGSFAEKITNEAYSLPVVNGTYTLRLSAETNTGRGWHIADNCEHKSWVKVGTNVKSFNYNLTLDYINWWASGPDTIVIRIHLDNDNASPPTLTFS